VHVASENRSTDPSLLRSVNVDGTRAVLDRLPPSVRGVIHGSSMSVYGTRAQECVTESAPTCARHRARPYPAGGGAARPGGNAAARRKRLRAAAAIPARRRGPLLPADDGPAAALPLRLAPERVQLSVMEVDDYAEVMVRLVERAHGNALRATPMRRALNVAYRQPVTLRCSTSQSRNPRRLRPRCCPPRRSSCSARCCRAGGSDGLTALLELSTRSHWADVRALEHEIGSDLTGKSPVRVLRACQAASRERRHER
jgi:hypothetical protein